MRITSTENAKVKEAVRLRRRAAREETGAFLVEGVREVERALAAGVRPLAFFVAPHAADTAAVRAWEAGARAAGAERFDVSERVYEKIAMRDGSRPPATKETRMSLAPSPFRSCTERPAPLPNPSVWTGSIW